MNSKPIKITLAIPFNLYQQLTIEADKGDVLVNDEIISRLEKTFDLDEVEKELHDEVERLKENDCAEKNNGNGTSRDIAIQNEELRIMMTKMERLEKDLGEIKNIVKNKIR